MRAILFLLFFISGFCGLVYQLVWTRLAFAAFGIITPVLSVVISVFMLGLSAGSWAAGKYIEGLVLRTRISAAVFYALAEFCIGLGAFCVPQLFSTGQGLLEASGQSNSLPYLILSAVVLATAILPWCLCMGATFPLVMSFLRERGDTRPETFSYLYLANVLGATSGVILAALVLIELFGFHDTLHLAAAGNFCIALISLKLGLNRRPKQAAAPTASEAPTAPPAPAHFALFTATPRLLKTILFTTGFVSMAMEVVWTRAFAPVLKTQVYSFALVVAVYLAATFVGTSLYRYGLERPRKASLALIMLLLCVTGMFPVLAGNVCFDLPRIHVAMDGPLAIVLLLAAVGPFCGILGYLTPRLVDQIGAGSPSAAGSAYALNVLGCILGPLFASYGLLAWLSERHSSILLVALFAGLCIVTSRGLAGRRRAELGLAAAAVLAFGLFVCRDFEDVVFANDHSMRVRRDYAASVIAVGHDLDKFLLVNGNSMSSLKPITKFMAHLPLAYHRAKPTSALVICFGMGTSFRSALSWNIQTTAVELVPSVTKMFDFFFADARQQLLKPNAHLVIDDGRRYLNRTQQKFDVIIVDPPPPVEAAGSSLLYSTEFYAAAKQHLNPGGIIQAWVPENLQVAAAALRSLCDSFPYVRCFGSVEGRGVHFLASMEPLPTFSAAELVSHMPLAARADLLEWAPTTNTVAYLATVLHNEFTPDKLLPPNPEIRITDDFPYNEYYLLRKWRGW